MSKSGLSTDEDSNALKRVLKKQTTFDTKNVYELFQETRGRQPETPQSMFNWLVNKIRSNLPTETTAPLFELQMISKFKCVKKGHKFQEEVKKYSLDGFVQTET